MSRRHPWPQKRYIEGKTIAKVDFDDTQVNYGSRCADRVVLHFTDGSQLVLFGTETDFEPAVVAVYHKKETE